MTNALAWWTESDARARRAFVAAALGWMLNSFDVNLYAVVLAALITDPALQLSFKTAGVLGALTLIAAAAGGVASGIVADKIGRKRTLIVAILCYSIFTAACGLAQSAMQLAVFRIFLGLGMGGEWAPGAALVSESFPARHRGKALAFVQSAWAIGYGLAALTTLIVLPRWGWRGVFFVGIAPALVTLWIRTGVEEPAIWRETSANRGRVALLFAPHVVVATVFLTLMNACSLFGYWAQSSWVPAYLALSPSRGGIGLSSQTMSLFVIAMQMGLWVGYVSFGYLADAFGRRRTYAGFLVATSVLLPIFGWLRTPWLLLMLGPIVSCFGGGFFSGFAAVVAELYPTSVRATANGVCFNTGRVVSAAAPFVVGSLAETGGFGVAFGVAGVSYLLAATMWFWIPETANAELV